MKQVLKTIWILVCLTKGGFLYSLTQTWDGSSSSAFNTGANWNGNAMPGAGDNAIIVNAGTAPILDADRSVTNFTMTSGTLDLGGRTLTITGSATFTSGTISNGTITISGPGGNVNFSGTTFSSNTTINLTKTVNTFDYYFNSGTFNCVLNLANTYASGTNFFVNDVTLSGNVTVSISGSSDNYITFGYDGAVTLASGASVSVGAGGLSTGTLSFREFTQLGSTASTITTTGNAIVDLGGATASSGTVGPTFNGNLTITGPVIEVSHSTFNGAATFNFNAVDGGSGRWSGSNTFNGTTIIENSGDRVITLADAEWGGATAGDDFNGDVTYKLSNASGTLKPAYNYTTTYAGNVSFTGSVANITLGDADDANPAGSKPVIKFDGANAQIISGNSTYTFKFNDMVIDKTANGVTLAVPIYIGTGTAEDLTLTSGNINTDATNLLIMNDNATYTGGSNSSYVDGPLRKVGNDAFVFPVGDGGYMHQIGISAPDNTAYYFTATDFFADPNAAGYTVTSKAGTLDHINRQQYWTLDRSAGGSNEVVTLYWNANSGGIDDYTKLQVARWNSGTSAWVDHDGAGVGDNTSGSIASGAAVTTFSPFALSSNTTANPLPVDLLSFNAQQEDETTVNVFWETASETNSDEFIVERSFNLFDWQMIGSVPAAGNSSEKNKYSLFDMSPLQLNYYRLKQIDLDGHYKYYGPIQVLLSSSFTDNTDLAIYPNPSDGSGIIKFSLNVETPIELFIFDQTGQVVQKFENTNPMNKGVYSIEFQGLAAGQYIVQLKGKELNLSEKMITTSR